MLVALGIPAVSDQVERGAAAPGAFGLLVAGFSLLLVPLANQLEAAVFGIAQRPWLSGRLSPWQRLILPYSTARVLTLGLGWGFGGGAYLLEASPGGSVLNILAVLSCASGGALLGFGMSRLAAGLFLIRYSGLWGPSRRAWLASATATAIGSLSFSAHSIITTMGLSPIF